MTFLLFASISHSTREEKPSAVPGTGVRRSPVLPLPAAQLSRSGKKGRGPKKVPSVQAQ